MSDYEKNLKRRLKRDTFVGIGIILVLLVAYFGVIYFL